MCKDTAARSFLCTRSRTYSSVASLIQTGAPTLCSTETWRPARQSPPLASCPRQRYPWWMIRLRKPSTRKNKGMGTKSLPEYRAEVEPLFPEPNQYGWRIYRRGEDVAFMRASVGYATEAEAWTAAGSERDRLRKAPK
jgi:hypothetical protein